MVETVATPAWASYRPGVTTASGEAVREVLQMGDKGCVFLNDQGELCWEYDSCANGLAAERHATGLIAQLGFAGLRNPSLRRAQLLIATSLSSAFEDASVTDCSQHFENARTFLTVRQTEMLQTAYLLAAFIAGILVTAFGLTLATRINQEFKDFAIATGIGGLGAVLSVSQRFRSIPIDRFSSRQFTILAGVARIVFGALFGAVLILLQRSGMVLAAVNDNHFALATAALVAGFSERLIPELIGSVEAKLIQPEQNHSESKSI